MHPKELQPDTGAIRFGEGSFVCPRPGDRCEWCATAEWRLARLSAVQQKAGTSPAFYSCEDAMLDYEPVLAAFS